MEYDSDHSDFSSSSSSSSESGSSNASEEEVDIDTSELFRTHLEGYTECRRPRYNANTMSKMMRGYLKTMTKRATRLFHGSSYVILQEHASGHKSPIPQNQDPNKQRHKILPKVLETGKLHGCILKKHKHTEELSIVATEPLEQGTPVAVNSGIVWSEDCYGNWIKDLGLGETTAGLLHHNIPADIFEPLFTPEKWKTTISIWARHQSFVMECSSSGNEMKYLEDANWGQCSNHNEGINPNVESAVVLNLSEQKEGESPLTVYYFVNQKVEIGERLSMDWGGWKKISTDAIPKQAFLSHVGAMLLEETKSTLHQNGIDYPDHMEIQMGKDDDMDNLFCSLEQSRLSPENAREFARQDTTADGAVSFLYSIVFQDNSPLRPEKKPRMQKYRVVTDFALIGIDTTLCRTTLPTSLELLSQSTRTGLDSIVVVKKCPKVKEMLNTNILDIVEVGEILDIENPAKLYGALPGEMAHGVFAKRDFEIGDPVMCYAGYLMDNEDISLDDNAYVFEVNIDAHWKKEDFDGDNLPDLFIDGKQSIAGLINDPVSLGSATPRHANLESQDTLDPETNYPMILLVATRKICKGDELLYSYNEKYWKYLWKGLMRRHRQYIIQTELSNQQLLELLEHDC